MNLELTCKTLKEASKKLAIRSTEDKNKDLEAVAKHLRNNRDEIKKANAIDVQKAKEAGISSALISRLELTDAVLDSIETSLITLVNEKDPIGEIVSGWKMPNGLEIKQIRVPLGVASVIYESRPNVTVDVFSLAYKSSNSILLRGSSSALSSNKLLVKLIQEALKNSGGIDTALALSVPQTNNEDPYADVNWILNAVGKIDVVFPRGGPNLINRVVKTAKVPVIETGAGVCHLYIDKDANKKMALDIAENAKTQRPGVCNSIECLLIHKDEYKEILPELVKIYKTYEEKTNFLGGVELRCDTRSYNFLKENSLIAENIIEAKDEDWGYEFLDYILAIKIVDSIDEAIEFINTNNTKHSDSIITESRNNARKFQTQVDSACVYTNASTRFTDGGEFGMGAELGISTQKLHVRGPMGLTALTAIKYLIDGEGQVRP